MLFDCKSVLSDFSMRLPHPWVPFYWYTCSLAPEIPSQACLEGGIVLSRLLWVIFLSLAHMPALLFPDGDRTCS